MAEDNFARDAVARALRIIDQMLNIATKATRDQWSPDDAKKWDTLRAKLTDIIDHVGAPE